MNVRIQTGETNLPAAKSMSDITADVRRSPIDRLGDHEGEEIAVNGWLYNKRSSKGLQFLILRDGSGLLQVVVNENEVDAQTWSAAEDAAQETSMSVVGRVKADERQPGGFELQATSIRILGDSQAYPITPKEHGIEFLMQHRHLWLRSRRPWAIMRIRNRVIMAIHEFFQSRGFLQMDAPILTGNAVEGTSTLFEIDYFGDKAYLTQSGQLYGEAMALAFGKIYTFGPTFRAEKSKTRRHLTEFWMIEPEMAFFDLDMTMDLAEDFVISVTQAVLEHCDQELEVLARDKTPLERISSPFPRISYTEAVDLLTSTTTADLLDRRIDELSVEKDQLQSELRQARGEYGQAKKWRKRQIDAREIEIHQRLEEIEEHLRNLPSWKRSALQFEWGADFGGSDETILTWHYDRPIIVHRYPAEVKAFYMKRDPEDQRLALGMDVLAPEGYGEVIGGGERATDLRFLEDQISAHGLPSDVFEWYLDLRRYGSVPHAGFGLGLERTLTWICGIDHVRETIPFPRMMARIEP